MKMERAQQKQTTLVLGGTGKTGRRVALRLAPRGVPTRVVSRSGEPPFDWENEATWAPALRDVESVYVSYFPDPRSPGCAGGGSPVRRAGRGGWSQAARASIRPRRGGPAHRASVGGRR